MAIFGNANITVEGCLVLRFEGKVWLEFRLQAGCGVFIYLSWNKKQQPHTAEQQKTIFTTIFKHSP